MGSEQNPVEDFLSSKVAGFGSVAREAAGGFMDTARQLPRHLGAGAATAGGAALGTAAVVGAGVAAQKLYDAATKGRDFRMMLDHDPALAVKHEENPKLFNQFYSTLRTFNPDFAKDPVVAGRYLHQMMDAPEAAGGVVVETLNFRDKIKSPTEAITRAAVGGITDPHSAPSSSGQMRLPFKH